MINKEELEEYIKEGLTIAKIAVKSNHGKTSVVRYLKKYNLFTAKHKCAKRLTVKTCYICGELNPSKFEPKRFSECKKCRCEYQKRIKQKRKVDLVNYKGGKCEKCGYNKCYAVLSFHHRDPTKKDFEICGSNKALHKLKIEADKCDLLCANCHLETHYLANEIVRHNRV
jgi:hypothetical protein